jgi:hypothetical protein
MQSSRIHQRAHETTLSGSLVEGVSLVFAVAIPLPARAVYELILRSISLATKNGIDTL